MIWLVLRRQRVALLLALGLVVVSLGVLLAARIVVLATAARLGVTECLRAYGTCDGTAANPNAVAVFDGYVALALLLPVALPALVGIVAGAGLFGRELEQGTHVFALTQSVGRLRWFASGLLVAGLPVAVVMALAAPALAWIREPALALYTPTPLESPVFESSGLMFAAYALLGFTLAAVAGLLLRNVLAAVVLVIVVQFALQLTLATVARPTYLPPETVTTLVAADGSTGAVNAPGGGMVVDFGFTDRAGNRLPDAVVLSDPCGGALPDVCPGRVVHFSYTDYQPASRYWPLQAIEAGVLALVGALAVGAGTWAMRRRMP
jgi:ABC-type transport system involved in multi-copper enzyme maturation permease subunit